LCGGDKSGGSEKRFYRQLISKADARFDAHARLLPKQVGTSGRKEGETTVMKNLDRIRKQLTRLAGGRLRLALRP